MGNLVYACVAPHGYEIIEEIAGPEVERFRPIREGMEVLGREMAAAAPDTIILATPHGFRVDDHVAVAVNEFAAGQLTKYDAEVNLSLRCDQVLAEQLLDRAKAAGLPAVRTFFGASGGSWSVLPLDWGTFIPMWFLGGRSVNQPKVVVVTPARSIGLEGLVRFGEVIYETIQAASGRIAFVASADQGHAHSADGLYGYHPASAEYDAQICQLVSENRLEDLLTFDPEFVDNAKPDSLWQMAMLLGIHRHQPLEGRLVSYNAPTYYGMMCASYSVVD